MKSAQYINDSDISDDDSQVIKNLDYKPPKDFIMHRAKKDVVSAFDVDETVEHEMWLIRVPEGVTNEDLASMSISVPSSTSSSETAVLGSIKKKEISGTFNTSTKYQLQTIAKDDPLTSEMATLKALVPDSSKGGKLVQTPVGFKRHLAVVAHASVPSGSVLAQEILERPIPERAQPQGLKARFKFAGVDTQEPGQKLTGSGKEFARKWKEEEARRLKQKEEDAQRLEEARQYEAEQAAAAEAGEQSEAVEDTPAAATTVEQEAGSEDATKKSSKKRKTEEAANNKAKKTKTIDEAETAKEKKEKKKEKKEKKDKSA
ncbi:hypothetical protein DFQ26_003555 [Actinomortierella ambigua]|nr:hypothetical protein DFQ26_003555 [Actinomortierella ambigua]